MTRKLMSFVALILMFFAVGMVQAKDAAPFAEVSIASYNTLDANAELLGKMLDNPQIGILLKMLDAQLGEDIMGVLDKTKPIGVSLYYFETHQDANPISFMTFLPLSKQEPLLEKLAQMDEQIEAKDDFEFEKTKMTQVSFSSENNFYLITKEGWTFVSDKPELLLNLPKNPAEILGDLPAKYALATKFHIDQIPEKSKKWLIDQIESGITAAENEGTFDADSDEDDIDVDSEDEDADEDEDQADDKADSETVSANDNSDDDDDSVEDAFGDDTEDENEEDEQIGALKNLEKISNKAQLENVKLVLNEVKTITIGFGADAKKETLFLDCDVDTIEGSSFSKAIQTWEKIKLYTNVLLPDATVAMSSTTGGLQSQIDSYKTFFPLYKTIVMQQIKNNVDLSDDKLAQLEKLIDKSLNFSLETMNKSVDNPITGGGAFYFKDNDLSYVAGAKGIDSAAYDSLIKEWVDFLDKDKKYYKADVEQWNGLTFSLIDIPTAKLIEGINKLDEADNSDDEDEDADEDSVNTTEEFTKWIKKTYGDNLQIAFAFGKEQAFAALGKDAVGLIKKAASNDAKAPQEVQQYMVINLQEIFETFSKLPFIQEDARDTMDALATSAKGEDSQAKIYVTAKCAKKNVCFRLEGEKGVFRAINTLIMFMSMGL